MSHRFPRADRRASRGPAHGAARLVAGLLVMVLVAACDSSPKPTSTPGPSQGPIPSTPPGPSPGATPTPVQTPAPTAAAQVDVQFAVVTGITNLKAVVSVDELTDLAGKGEVAFPCGFEVSFGDAPQTVGECLAADAIPAAIRANPKQIALLPPGLVEPATKVLPIAGDGPFGLFGADLFGGPEARALPYPITGRTTGDPAVSVDWIAYDAAGVWTLNETGSLCADRGGAKQAVTLGKGWDWVFGGGTAEYRGGPIPHPNPPPGIDRHPIVLPRETGNDGVTPKLIRQADVTLGNLKCPVLPTADWRPANQALGLSVPEDVLSRWEELLGIDAVYLPADHQSDRGVRGIRSTLKLLGEHQFPHTGLGMDLDEALEPAYLDVAGQKVAFVAWNNVPGPTHAADGVPGVAWLTKANVNAAVGRAKAGGATVIICDPQWWGPDEYIATLTPQQARRVGWMEDAGCDQILAGGLHITGGLYLREGPNGVRAINTGPGNFQYGQDFWQQTQEGVVVELVFRGATLVNVRLHPYVMVLAARAALLDPEGDGHYVLQRAYKNGEVDYGD